MKVNITLSLDLELVQKLKREINGSGLVNIILLKHYGESQSKEENKKELAEEKEKVKNSRVLIKDLQEKRKLLIKEEKILKQIPKGIIEDWKNFPLMTEEIMIRKIPNYRKIYKDLDEEILIEAFNAFR